MESLPWQASICRSSRSCRHGPEIGAPPADEIVTVDPYGAGFGDPVTRAVVRLQPFSRGHEHYRKTGHVAETVERDKRGWDLTCTGPDGSVARVEATRQGEKWAQPSPSRKPRPRETS